MTRDDLFVDLALKSKMVTPAQLEDCRNLRMILGQNGFDLTFAEIMSRKEILTSDQLRLINVAIRYEETKTEDAELGAFIVRKGFLPEEKIRECLAAQEKPFKEGRHFPRLEDQLVQKGYLSAQQVHVILRARDQLEAARKEPASSSRMPRIQPSLPAVPPEPPAPARPAVPFRTLEAGLTLQTLRAGLRRAKGTGEPGVVILDLDGALDGHTARAFDGYLNALFDAGAVRLIVSCGRLDHLSSAGIGVIAGAVKRCRDAKGDLRFCDVPEPVRKVMHLVGLLSLLRLYDSERGAVMSFKYE